MTATQLDGKTVRDVLLQLLKGPNVEPREDWVAVRAVRGPGAWSGTYVVVIGYPAAKVALWPVLDRVTGGKQGTSSKVGIWVLTESEARMLCERHPVQN